MENLLNVFSLPSHQVPAMARGHQKLQSQQKNAKKQAEAKKSKGHDQKAAAKAALVFTCTVCRVWTLCSPQHFLKDALFLFNV